MFLLLFLVLILFLANVKYISISVIESLNFCYKSLIPSLFPFMVLSSVILYTTRNLGNSKISNFVLGNCKIYANEILLGSLCGFIIGAKGICEKYNATDSKKDFNRAIILSSNAGLGFVIGCVGCVIWKSLWFGISLYVSQILSAFIIFKFRRVTKNIVTSIPSSNHKPISFFSAVVKSVKISTSSILTICGFNIFFSALCDLINNLLKFQKGEFAFVLTNVIMDFSKGAFCISQLSNIPLCAFLTGFCIGFGGLCVHMQIYAECENYPLSRLKFTASKLLQGVFCGVFMLVFTYTPIFKKIC